MPYRVMNMARGEVMFVLACLFVVVYAKTSTNQSCYDNKYICGWSRKVCCNGTCQKECLGKFCKNPYECGSSYKCCDNKCQPSCEGARCVKHRDCSGLQCCNKVCQKHCLGAACSLSNPQCGRVNRRNLICCGGECMTSCEGQQCETNTDCGGYGYRTSSCCNGVCKRSCKGSPCLKGDDCRDIKRGQRLECCGFYDEKTCQHTCRGRDCSIDEDCHDQKYKRFPLRCCGNEKCYENCHGSICSVETIKMDCKGPQRLYCCGIGQKRCRYSCHGKACKSTQDCGPTNYYCRNSRCTITTGELILYIPT